MTQINNKLDQKKPFFSQPQGAKNLQLSVLTDAPPSYDDVVGASSSSAYAFTTAGEVPSRPISYQISPFSSRNILRYQHRKKSFFAPLREGRNWVAIIYLILWDLPYASFCFGWVIGTLFGSICSLIIPPVGYVLLLFSVYSWRMLARLEIAIFNSISQPSNIALSTHTPLPSITQRTPIIYSSNLNHDRFQGRFKYLFSLFKDGFTVRAVMYFIFVKLVISIAIFALTISLFVLGVISLLLLLPFCLSMSRLLVDWEARMARKLLLD